MHDIQEDEAWLKSLDTETVKSRSTVEHDGVLFNNLVKNCPHLGCLLLYKSLCPLHIESNILLNKLSHDERLEKLKSHL